MTNCADCQSQECQTRGKESLNEACPMQDKEFFEEVRALYHTEENQRFYENSLKSMRGSFARWSRIREIMEFCKYNGFTRIGLAYCSGMTKEGRLANDILKANGFTVIAAGCKLGGFSPEELCDGYEPAAKSAAPAVGPTGVPLTEAPAPVKKRAICDPIGQAMLLNREKTQFNVVVGLCVGHDSLFLKYADAPCSVLVAKDRLLNNNPVAALYCYSAND